VNTLELLVLVLSLLARLELLEVSAGTRNLNLLSASNVIRTRAFVTGRIAIVFTILSLHCTFLLANFSSLFAGALMTSLDAIVSRTFEQLPTWHPATE
jgi:hypothetical protein